MNKKVENKLLVNFNLVITWILVIDTCLLVAPNSLTNGIALLSQQEYRFTLWFIFIIAFSNFISQAIIHYTTKVINNINTKNTISKLTNAVTCLDFTEKALLREFVIQRKSVINLPINEPSVRNLIENGLLVPTDYDMDEEGRLPIMINTIARPLITYKAVGLTKNKMSEEQIDQIVSARPKYARA